jgi:hypothetical protein
VRATMAVLMMALVGSLSLVGCGPVKVDFATLKKPMPAPELEPLGRFVGSWTLEAERSTGDGNTEKWTGTATWKWVLDDMYLYGDLGMHGPIDFIASGYWGWQPVKKTYMWWMLNDWGYPQWGTATYDDEQKLWVMKYKGVGLDGTDSWGQYTLQWVDDNTVTWEYHEWADLFKTIKKIEMRGAYKRK